MKLSVLFFTLFASLLHGENNAIVFKTNSYLESDKFIWPIPKIEKTSTTIFANSQFISSKVIFSVEQGNWINKTYLIEYKVLNNDLIKNITFICKDSWPTKESGIILKKLPNPFVKGKMEFIIEPDSFVRHRPYYKIISYHKIP